MLSSTRRAFIRLTAMAALAFTAGCGAHAAPQAGPAAPTKESVAAVGQLQTELATVFNGPVMAHGTWGVHVRSLDRGDTLFAHNAGKLMMPASNMKILTVAAGAELLGWDHRFTTVLETTAPVQDGVLKGDLIVRGGGDPTVSTRGKRDQLVFDEWAAALRAAGITTIEGRIIGDDQAFEEQGVGPGWSWDYLEAGYAAPVGALQFNDNTADLRVSPGAAAGQPAIVELAPGSGLSVVNHVRTVEAVAGGPRGSINVERRIDRPEIQISGRIPVDGQPISRTVAVLNPTLFFARSLKDALIARGIGVTGEAVDGDDVAAELSEQVGVSRRELATASAPLRDVATVLMKVSQNQYAETVLKALGAARGGIATTTAGRQAAAGVFRGWGVPDDGYVISDGSGLSRYNYVSPSAITTILARLHEDPRHREAFAATLPIAGKDGTIASRMRRSRAEGNAIAKTGSIANVRALSGYVKTRTGEVLVFSILANDFVIPPTTVTWIADLAVEILANFNR